MGSFYSKQSNYTDLCLECGVDEVLDQYSSSRVCFGWALGKDLPHSCECSCWPMRMLTVLPKEDWSESSSESMKGRLSIETRIECSIPV